MRLLSKGKECAIKLEDKTTGELFAKCPIDAYPGIAIEPVTDSSRYFVLRIQDDNGESSLCTFVLLKCKLQGFFLRWGNFPIILYGEHIDLLKLKLVLVYCFADYEK